MPGLLEKRRLRQRLYSKPVIALLVVIVALLGKAAFDAYVTMRGAHERLEQEERQLTDLEERETALSEEVSALSSERGVEREVRQKFDVGKEGEGVIVITDAPVDSDEAGTGESRSGWFGRLLDLFAR